MSVSPATLARIAEHTERRFDGIPVDAHQARVLARELEGTPNPILRRAVQCVRRSVPVEAFGPVRPSFSSLTVAEVWDAKYERRFGRNA